MRLSRFIIATIAVLSLWGCTDEFSSGHSRLTNTDWVVYEWQATTTCSCMGTDWGCHDSNAILDELMGLYDYHHGVTELSFHPGNRFSITRDGHVMLQGDANLYYDEIVLYSYSERLSLSIVVETSSRMVLKTIGSSTEEVELVMRRVY